MAFGSGYLGIHLSAVTGFGAGHLFGRPLLRKIDSKRVRRLDEQLKEGALLPMVLVRIIPVAPFVVVNMAAGASRLRFGVFNLGTVLGMAPGMAMVVLLTHEVGRVLTEPVVSRNSNRRFHAASRQ